jgi:hypothetical protein
MIHQQAFDALHDFLWRKFPIDRDLFSDDLLPVRTEHIRMSPGRATHIRENRDPRNVFCGRQPTPRLEGKSAVFLQR